MRKKVITGILMVLCASVMVLGTPQESFGQTGTLTGKVADAKGVLAGATVAAGSQFDITGSNGEYSLSITPGSYTVRVSYVGHLTASRLIVIKAGEVTHLDFTMEPGGNLDELVVLGSRSRVRRSGTQTPVPVDVITADDLASTGQVEPTQMINVVAPSFNSSRQTVSDGTDHIDPATLRGLGPDQVLVLVNGKRRHNTALMNINGTVGRGSVGTDLNSIPVAAIERLEVLRDGAASQYGSDAIAGVINVVLKKTKGTTFTTHVGQQYKGDGEVAQLGINHGIVFRNKGFLNIAADLRYRGATNRAGDYTGPVYIRWDNDNNLASRQTKYDNDQAMIAQRQFNRSNNMGIGNSQVRNAGAMINGGIPLGATAELYFTTGFNYRNSEAAGFYRYPYQTSQVIPEIYPDGFLPQIHSKQWDKSILGGVKFATGEWGWDISNTFGGNSFRFDVANSNNASQFTLAANAPTEFYSGTLHFDQNTFNVDVNRSFGRQMGLPSFSLAFGAEWRTDLYKITAGEEASWKNYSQPTDGKVGGAQVFPGFQPANAVNANRAILGAYVDLESDVTNKLLVNVAARVEHYSDFGSNVAGKLALRYKVTRAISLRGAISNGFRAPSLHQRYFSAVSSLFVNVNGTLQPRLVGTFRNNSDVATAFGIPSLDAEKSKNASLGITVKAGNRVSITLDGYFIRIDNRIVYTGQFARSNATVNALLVNYPDVNGAQFFTNAVNTETRGIDLVTTFQPGVSKGHLEFILAGNLNETTVVGTVKGTSKVPADQFGNELFSRQERSRLEESQPKSKISLSANYRIGKWGFNARAVRYGEVAIKDVANVLLDESFSPKTTTDLSLSYKIVKSLQISVGANNVLDVYPDKLQHINYPKPGSTGPFLDNSSFGRFIYSRNATQFGFNGGYYYMTLALQL